MCVCAIIKYIDGISLFRWDFGSNLFLFFHSELGRIVESSEIIHVAER